MYIEQYLGAIEKFGRRNAVTCLSTDRTLTYVQLNAITNQLSNRFRSDGFKKGDVVMTCLYNTWHFPVVMLGSWKNLQVFSPINFRLSSGEMRIHLEDSRPAVFIYDADLEKTIEEALESSSHKPAVVISTERSSLNGVTGFDDYIGQASEEDPDLAERLEQLDNEKDEIERLYTSGTTGFPKGVRFNGRSLFNCAVRILYNNNYQFTDKLLGMAPWFHQGGAITIVQPGLLAGAHIFGLKKFDAANVLDYVQKYRLTFLSGVPATYNAASDEQQARPRDLSSLRLVHSSGSAASRREFKSWEKVICPNLVNSYGTTEIATATGLRSAVHPIHEKAGSVGVPAIFTRGRVVKLDVRGKRAEPNDLVANDGQERGEFIARSNGMLMGYHNRPEEEAKKMYKGWFYTGDTATVDKDGFIYIQGRTDDMFVSGGENIFPQVVEEVLEKHPKVKEAAVVGMADEKWGWACTAYVVAREEGLSLEELDQHCINDPDLPNFKRPRYYRFVESLAMNAAGKKMRYVMKEQAGKEKEKFIAVPSKKSNA